MGFTLVKTQGCAEHRVAPQPRSPPADRTAALRAFARCSAAHARKETRPAIRERDALYWSSPSPPLSHHSAVEGADEFIGLSFHMATGVSGGGVRCPHSTPSRASADLFFHLRGEFPFVREFREARVPTVATKDVRHEVSGQFRPTPPAGP